MRVNSKLSTSLSFADPRGRLVSEFASNDALVEALLTSSHLPFYSNGNPARRFDGAWHYDGGVANFLPGVPSADYNVRVCCFPSQNINLVRLLPFTCEQCACWLRPRGPTASWRGCCGNRYCFALCACCLCKQSMHWTARMSCVFRTAQPYAFARMITLCGCALEAHCACVLSLPELSCRARTRST